VCYLLAPEGRIEPHGVQSWCWFHFARKDCPVIAPRVTFLRERFWANGVESDRTVENPEPFLAPLPSLWAVSSEIEWIQRSSSRFPGQFFSGWNMRFESVSICQNAYHFSRPVLQIPSACSTLCFNFLLKPLINLQIHQVVCQKKHFLSTLVCISTSFLVL
jgi:hypothetical protein